jgi:hypothetical protein
MPRRTKKSLRRLPKLAKRAAELAGDLELLSRRAMRLSDELQRVEALAEAAERYMAFIEKKAADDGAD